MNKKYYISFDTKDRPGVIMAVSVVLDREMISDMNKQLPINLCDHPLYPELVQYVKANPVR